MSVARPAPMAVGTRPGQTQFTTRTPYLSFPVAIAETRVSRSIADLVAAYTSIPGNAIVAATEEMLMTLPPLSMLETQCGAQDVGS